MQPVPLGVLALLATLAACAGTPDDSFGSGGTSFEGTGTGSGGSSDGGDDGSTGDADDTGDTGGSDGGDDGGDDGGSTDDTGIPTITGTGYQVGDTAYDLSDGTWSLHEQYGSPVVLAVGHMDVQTTLDTLAAMEANRGKHPGVVMAAYLGRDETKTVPDEEDLTRWQEAYDLDAVLIDPTLNDVNLWADSTSTKLYILDAELKILWVNYGVTEATQLDDKLDDLL